MRRFSVGTGVSLIVAVLLTAPSGAVAQAGSGLFGGGAGAAVPVSDFGDLSDEGALYGAWTGVGLYDHGDLVLRFQQSFHDLQQEEPDAQLFGDTDVTLTTATVGPKFYLTPPGVVARPFVVGEIGWTRIEIDDGGRSVLDDDDRFTFGFGGGLELGRAAWGLGVEVRYLRHVASGDRNDLGTVVPMGVFTWRLLP